MVDGNALGDAPSSVSTSPVSTACDH